LDTALTIPVVRLGGILLYRCAQGPFGVCGGEGFGIHFSWAMGWCRSSVMHILLRVMLYHPTRELLLLRSLPRRKLLRSKPGIIIPKLHERIK
jgi:hypothetical protein